jgi:hypothetical protein
VRGEEVGRRHGAYIRVGFHGSFALAFPSAWRGQFSGTN